MRTLRRQLPNIFTFARILLTPAFLFSLFEKTTASGFLSIALFALLAITDCLDGYFARKWQVQTSFGEFMDPLADKILVCGAFVSFLLIPGFVIPVWLVILILFRELFVTILRVVATKRSKPIKTEYAGKVKTVFQMFTIFCLLFLLLLKKLYFPLVSTEDAQKLQWTMSFGGFWGSALFFLPTVLVALSAFLALLSMVQYLFKNLTSIINTDRRDAGDFLLKLFATGFFAGYFPLCPGTFASLIGVALWIVLPCGQFFPFFVLVFTGLSFVISHYAEKRVFLVKDSSKIVVDEISGMLVTYLSFSFSRDTRGFLYLLGGLVLFRIFDIFKPPPIKNLQKVYGGFGIMLDDLVSAAFANGILQVLRLLLIE